MDKKAWEVWKKLGFSKADGEKFSSLAKQYAGWALDIEFQAHIHETMHLSWWMSQISCPFCWAEGWYYDENLE